MIGGIGAQYICHKGRPEAGTKGNFLCYYDILAALQQLCLSGNSVCDHLDLLGIRNTAVVSEVQENNFVVKCAIIIIYY